MIIAIDGPIGAGKKDIARTIARHFNLPHLSTGMMYRAAAYQLMLNRGDPDCEADAVAACDFPVSLFEEPELQAEYIGGFASRISVHAKVREALFDRLWRFAHREGGCVLDGRDVGTTIAPDADVKLFLVADFKTRLRRISQRYRDREDPLSPWEIEIDVRERDRRDRLRAIAPLRQATDATVLDTSSLDRKAADAAALRIVDGVLAWPPTAEGRPDHGDIAA